jgi:hypothetical protein
MILQRMKPKGIFNPKAKMVRPSTEDTSLNLNFG